MKKYLLLALTLLLSSCTSTQEPIQNESQDNHIFIEENFDFPAFHEKITSSKKLILTGFDEESIMPNHSWWGYEYKDDQFTLNYVKADENDIINFSLYLMEPNIVDDPFNTVKPLIKRGINIYLYEGDFICEVYVNVPEYGTIASSMDRNEGRPVDCGALIYSENSNRNYCTEEEEQIIMQQQEELSAQLKKMLINLGLDVDSLGINFYR